MAGRAASLQTSQSLTKSVSLVPLQKPTYCACIVLPLPVQRNPCRNQSRCGLSPKMGRKIIFPIRRDFSPHCASLCGPQVGGSGGTASHNGCTDTQKSPCGSSRGFFSLACQRNSSRKFHICTVSALCGEPCGASGKPWSRISHHTWGRDFLNHRSCGFASCG